MDVQELVADPADGGDIDAGPEIGLGPLL